MYQSTICAETTHVSQWNICSLAFFEEETHLKAGSMKAKYRMMLDDYCYLFYEFQCKRDADEVKQQQFILGIRRASLMGCLNLEE